MSERRYYKSSPGFEAIYRLATAIAALINPHVHIWPADQGGDNGRYNLTPEPERHALIQDLKDQMQKELDQPTRPEDAAGRN